MQLRAGTIWSFEVIWMGLNLLNLVRLHMGRASSDRALVKSCGS
jgi:hypothetical protein